MYTYDHIIAEKVTFIISFELTAYFLYLIYLMLLYEAKVMLS